MAEPKIFISYSPNDLAVVEQLEAALKARGFEPLVNRERTFASIDLWPSIEALITKADTMVVVLSPFVLGNPIFQKEVEIAASLNKRFVSIVRRGVTNNLVPEPLRDHKFIRCDDDAHFDDTVAKLAEALNADIDWIRRHTELSAEARRWEKTGKPRSLLLRAPVLEAAEHWIARRPNVAPLPTEATQEFITASRNAAMRKQNILMRVLTAALIVALGLVAFLYSQQNEARQRLEAAIERLTALEKGLGIAEKNEAQAKDQSQKADEQRRVTEQQRDDAVARLGIAEKNEAEANEQLQKAVAGLKEEERRRGIAEGNEAQAKEQLQITAEKLKNADQQVKDLKEQLDRAQQSPPTAPPPDKQ